MKLPKLFLCVTLFSCSHLLAEEGKSIKPLRDFGGIFAEDKDLPLKKAAPATGFLTDEKAYLKLWKMWNKDVKPPKVDIATELVLVATIDCAKNKLGGDFKLNDAGDLKATYASTLVAGPGFAWRMFVLPRDGIKTIGGKPVEE
jgi:hypothetical protein